MKEKHNMIAYSRKITSKGENVIHTRNRKLNDYNNWVETLLECVILTRLVKFKFDDFNIISKSFKYNLVCYIYHTIYHKIFFNFHVW